MTKGLSIFSLFTLLVIANSQETFNGVAVVVPSNGILTVTSINKNKTNLFRCDGVNDEVEINQAVKYLSQNNGGTLYLEYGFYNIQSKIVLSSNLSIVGIAKSKGTGNGNRRLLQSSCAKVIGECCQTGCPSSSCLANGLASTTINCNKNTCGLQKCDKLSGCSGNTCLGKVSCISKFNCEFNGEYCFYDGSSDNFKICTAKKATSSCEKSTSASVEGGHFVRVGVTKLDIAIQPHTASYTNILQLYTYDTTTNKLVLINDNIASNKADVGRIIPITLIDVQSEIVFAIKVLNTNNVWFMGDKSRNKDGLTHAVVTQKSNTMYNVSFEDLEGLVSYRNFDDFGLNVNVTYGEIGVYSPCPNGFANVAKSVDTLVCKQENAKKYENTCTFKLDSEYPMMKYTSSVVGSTVMFQTINKTNISIKNLNLEGVGSENVLQSGLYFKQCSNIKILEVAMFSFSRAGLRVQDTNDLIVVKSKFACNNYYGVEVVNSTQSTFTNTCIVQENRYGFKIHDNDIMTIQDNVITSNMYTFDMRNDSRLNIQENIFG
jgi:parallel beta-helix repeat protein